MEDLKQAYAALGLPENASKEEVEKRYFLLVRRARAERMREGGQPAQGGTDLEAITQAYRLIVGQEEAQARREYQEKMYGKYKKMAGPAEKIDHFFRYYKFHVLGAIVLILCIIFGIKGYMDHKARQAELAKLPPPAVTVTFFGEFWTRDGSGELPEDALLPLFPEWKRVVSTLTYVPKETRSEQDIALLQKSLLVLMTEKPDLYIMDRVNFDKLVKQGLFLPLDGPEAQKLLKAVPPDAQLKGRSEKDTADHVYGIDVTNRPLVSKLPVTGKEYIAVIRATTEKEPNALHFIERFWQQ
jgi:hypothetical protein